MISHRPHRVRMQRSPRWGKRIWGHRWVNPDVAGSGNRDAFWELRSRGHTRSLATDMTKMKASCESDHFDPGLCELCALCGENGNSSPQRTPGAQRAAPIANGSILPRRTCRSGTAAAAYGTSPNPRSSQIGCAIPDLAGSRAALRSPPKHHMPVFRTLRRPAAETSTSPFR